MEKILIVEDDTTLLFIISKTLENAGYKTLTAEDGSQAIEQLNQNSDIDLIITDLIMPIVDGIQLSKYIRNKKEFSHLPILVLTGQGDIYNKCQGFDAGVDDYVTKPPDFVEFMLRIKALLNRSKRIKQDESLEKDKIKKSEKFIFFKEKSTVSFENKEIYFTQTEFDIINYLYNKKEISTSSEELLEKILDYPKGVGNPVTIRTHIRNIRFKVEKEFNISNFIINIPKRGYVLNIYE